MLTMERVRGEGDAIIILIRCAFLRKDTNSVEPSIRLGISLIQLSHDDDDDDNNIDLPKVLLRGAMVIYVHDLCRGCAPNDLILFSQFFFFLASLKLRREKSHAVLSSPVEVEIIFLRFPSSSSPSLPSTFHRLETYPFHILRRNCPSLLLLLLRKTTHRACKHTRKFYASFICSPRARERHQRTCHLTAYS